MVKKEKLPLDDYKQDFDTAELSYFDQKLSFFLFVFAFLCLFECEISIGKAFICSWSLYIICECRWGKSVNIKMV